MSATFRFIDLCTNAFAPLLTGQLMTYVSSMYGAVFIGSWNICAFFIEYWLIGMVYRMNPALHSKDSTIYGMLSLFLFVGKPHILYFEYFPSQHISFAKI